MTLLDLFSTGIKVCGSNYEQVNSTLCDFMSSLLKLV